MTANVRIVPPTTFAGEPAVLTVIGESHYVDLPVSDFHELCSCKPLPYKRTHKAPFSVDVECEFSFESNRLDAQAIVGNQPLDVSPDPDDAAIVYRFNPEVQTIIRIADSGYETYHTYPEYDLALHMETTITPRTQR